MLTEKPFSFEIENIKIFEHIYKHHSNHLFAVASSPIYQSFLEIALHMKH